MIRRLLNKFGGFVCKLKPPTRLENECVGVLRNEIDRIYAGEKEVNPNTHPFWRDIRFQLRELIAHSDPRRFLTWGIIQKTMFLTHSDYLPMELSFLRKLPDWRLWKNWIAEVQAGDPVRYPGYKKSSGNLIHHAYHAARFRETTGLSMGDFNLVLELGGGYGNFCRLVYRMGFTGTYIILDLPEFSALQRFYLTLNSIDVAPENAKLVVGQHSVYCVSGIEQLVEIGSAENSLVVATWSLSETVLPFRDRFFSVPMVQSCNQYLIAYQKWFEDVDNESYFERLRSEKMNTTWFQSEILHIPGNYYLFGKKARSGDDKN